LNNWSSAKTGNSRSTQQSNSWDEQSKVDHLLEWLTTVSKAPNENSQNNLLKNEQNHSGDLNWISCSLQALYLYLLLVPFVSPLLS
jgi:hypothetical protein